MADNPVASRPSTPAADAAQDLLRFLDASPSPYHAVAAAAARLEDAGFQRLDEREPWTDVPPRAVIVRGGSLVAWRSPDGPPPRGYRIIGAHTDSPNLRVKPRPDTGRAGYRQLGVEVYGGALLNSWLDRDLGLSGRVVLRASAPGTGGAETRLLRVDRPLLRVPQLAIHLDRGVNENGLKLNPQHHLVPVWGLGIPGEGDFAAFLAAELGRSTDDVLAWDVMLHDLTPATLAGRHDEFISSARLDNLLSCWAATSALLDAGDPDDATEPTAAVVCLFDHEEIGSQSASGAAGDLLPAILERLSRALGLDPDTHLAALARSRCVSADGAHATHPNYPDRHEPAHHIRLDGGPVIKVNANVRYATDAESAAFFRLACAAADVPVQEFVVRSDLPCGSTIGPVTAARLGVPTVDVGVAQLAMHSARELCGSADPQRFRRALGAFLADA